MIWQTSYAQAECLRKGPRKAAQGTTAAGGVSSEEVRKTLCCRGVDQPPAHYWLALAVTGL